MARHDSRRLPGSTFKRSPRFAAPVTDRTRYDRQGHAERLARIGTETYRLVTFWRGGLVAAEVWDGLRTVARAERKPAASTRPAEAAARLAAEQEALARFVASQANENPARARAKGRPAAARRNPRAPDPPRAVKLALRRGAHEGCDFCEGAGWGRSPDYGDVPEPCAKCYPSLWRGGVATMPRTAAEVPARPGLVAVKLERAKHARAKAKAERAYRRVHWGHAGEGASTKATIVDGDHGTLVVLGELASVTYETTKGGPRAKPAHWKHDFEGSRPVLVFHDCERPGCAEKGKLTLAGGTYRVTTRGIVG